MPIRPKHCAYYPIDWLQLSAVIRFGRAGGHCEACGRPHRQLIVCLDDGVWYDADAGLWRNGRGRPMRRPPGLAALVGARLTLPILATCHREHDTSLNGDRDLAAWCQRCHLIHDRPEHRRRLLTYLRRRSATCSSARTRSRRPEGGHDHRRGPARCGRHPPGPKPGTGFGERSE